MDLHSENVQTGLPRPVADAGIEPATRENCVDLTQDTNDSVVASRLSTEVIKNRSQIQAKSWRRVMAGIGGLEL